MKLENAKLISINLHSNCTTATVTLTIENPTDDTLAALLTLANKPVVGTLAALPHTQPAG